MLFVSPAEDNLKENKLYVKCCDAEGSIITQLERVSIEANLPITEEKILLATLELKVQYSKVCFHLLLRWPSNQ